MLSLKTPFGVFLGATRVNARRSLHPWPPDAPWKAPLGVLLGAFRVYARRSLHPWPLDVPPPDLRPFDGTSLAALRPGDPVLSRGPPPRISPWCTHCWRNAWLAVPSWRCRQRVTGKGKRATSGSHGNVHTPLGGRTPHMLHTTVLRIFP